MGVENELLRLVSELHYVTGELLNGELAGYEGNMKSATGIEPGDKVEVVWLDAGFENSNMCIDEAKGLHPLERSNVGYFVSDAEDILCMAFGGIKDIDKNHCVYSDILIIPLGMVKSIKRQVDDSANSAN